MPGVSVGQSLGSLSIKLVFLATSLLILATAYSARRSPWDFTILGIGGIVGLGCVLVWFFEVFGPLGRSKSPALAFGSLALSPLTAYAMAVVFGIRFFFTDLTGWSRSIYLVGTVVGLTPFLLMALFAAMLVIGGKR
jgi:hypothetical protein